MDASPNIKLITPKYEWIQSFERVSISFLLRNLSTENIKECLYEKDRFRIVIERDVDNTIERMVFDIRTREPILAEKCSYIIAPSKIEVYLYKENGGTQWAALEAINSDTNIGIPQIQTTVYPSSKKKNIDWNKLEKEIEKDLDAENEQGEAALQKLFKDIYSRGDEDTRRAMIKSFQTSGGTVLSTNWEDVKAKNYEENLKAPDGQEVRSWTKES